MRFVDTHTHPTDEAFGGLDGLADYVARASAAGVDRMLIADVDSRERPAVLEAARRFPGVLFPMIGLYPGSVDENWRDELDQVQFEIVDQVQGLSKGEAWKADMVDQVQGIKGDLVQQAANGEGREAERGGERKRFVAVGEIGLDYHEGKEFAAEQKEVLRLQLEMAAGLGLPVNIHLRDAWEDFFAVLKDCRHLHLRGNLHCFTASYEIYERANRYADFSVGIGGVVTFKNASLPQAVAKISLEKILLETDAPYMAPTPLRGTRNESANIPLIAAKVAEVKGLDIEAVAAATTANAERLFGI